MSIKPSYVGTLQVGGVFLPVTAMSAHLQQKPEFYDHSIGLNDTGYTGSESKGPGVEVNRQKGIYRWGPKLGVGSASGPITENGIGTIVDAAINGTELSVIFGYNSQDGQTISEAKVSRVTLDVKAGDIASWTAEFTGKGFSDSGMRTSSQCQKLVTWDKCSVSSMGDDVVGFSLNISNPIIPIYVSGSEDLFPTAVRIGMQEVSGTVSMYNLPSFSSDGYTDLNFQLGTESWEASVVLEPPKPTSNSSSPFISTVQFQGAAEGAVFPSGVGDVIVIIPS